MNINLNDVQHEPIVVSASLTAVLNRYYVNTASATYTDPAPAEGEGFIVFVRNGTATVGGTGYATAGTIVYRYYHSGAWANYSFDINIQQNFLTDGTFTGGYISTNDNILSAFEIIDSYLPTFVDNTLTSGRIYVGNASNVAQGRTLSLSASAGTFALGNTGILTMPDAATGTRGLLNSTNWNTFNNKAPLTSPEFLTNINLTTITSTTSTNDIVETFTNNSSGTPAAGYGLSRFIRLKSSTTDSQSAGKEIWAWTDATHANRQSGYKIQLMGNTSVFGVGFQDAFVIGKNGNSFDFQLTVHSGYGPSLKFMSGTTQKANLSNSGNDFYFDTNTTGASMYFRPGDSTTALQLTTTAMTFSNAVNIVFNTSTGSKIGTATSQKLSFWNKTPIIQPTTGITAAPFVANTSGIVNDTATFGGYTIGQIAAALINVGILA